MSASSSKVPATPVKAPSTPAQPSLPATPSAPVQPAGGSSTAAVPETPTPAGSSVPSNFNDPSALAMGGEGEAAIQNMMAMGFERSEIERAMRAAFFNPDRAVDYLLNVSIACYTLRFMSVLFETDGPRHRASLTTSNKSDNLSRRLPVPLRKLTHPLDQPLLLAEMHLQKPQIPRISTYLKLLLLLPVSAQGVAAVVLVVVLEGLETLISFVTIHSSNSSDRLFNSSHRCSSRSCNR